MWTVCGFGSLQNVIRNFISKRETVAKIVIGSGCIFYSFSGDNVWQIQLCSLCDFSYDRRSVDWAAATQSMPGSLAESLGSLCDNENMIMLLSGLNCPKVPELQVIYEDIITFLATMYTTFNPFKPEFTIVIFIH